MHGNYFKMLSVLGVAVVFYVVSYVTVAFAPRPVDAMIVLLLSAAWPLWKFAGWVGLVKRNS